MSARDFSAALEAPDNTRTHTKLYTFAAKGPLSHSDLASTAEAYLQTFCDDQVSLIRRRWVGIALSKMIASSVDVIKHLENVPQGLVRLGDVILSKTEAEETKIVSGLIIREGLVRGVRFTSFWPSDKIQNSVPVFPRNANAEWMSEFQHFLDILADLLLANPVTDPLILFGVSLVASDGYKWTSPDAVKPILLMQGDLLTMIAADTTLHDICFVDIPLQRIQSVSLQRSTLHDSQGGRTNLEPWDAILKLEPNLCTYRLNSSERDGHEFTILFADKSTAKEFKDGIAMSLPENLPSLMANSDSLDFSTHSPNRQPNDSVATKDLTQARRAQHSSNDSRKEDEVEGMERSEASARHRRMSSRSKDMYATATTSSPPSALIAAENPLEYTKNSRRTAGAVSMAQEETSKSKAGALPVAQKAALPQLRAVLKSNGEDGFPEQLPRIKRYSAAKAKPTSKGKKVVSNRTTDAARDGRLALAEPEPRKKAKLKDQGVRDNEDEGDPLSSHSPRPMPRQASKSLSHGEPELREESSIHVPKTTGLPKVAKRSNPAASTSHSAESDIFALPQDQDVKLRKRRVVAKSIVYKEGESSPDDDSGSDYKERKNRTKAVSLVKRSTATNKPKLGKRKLSRENKAGTRKTTRPSNAATQPLSGRPLLLSNLHSQSQPNLTAAKTHSTSRKGQPLRGKENIPLARDMQSRDLRNGVEPTVPALELSILEKLNSAASSNDDDDDGLVMNQSPDFQNKAFSRKRPLDSSSTSTPRKRTKTQQSVAESEVRSGTRKSIIAPKTVVPLEVLADLSSPCSRQHQPSSTHSRGGSSRGMQPPANPNHGPITEATPSFQRQRSTAGLRSLPDRRCTPINQHVKRTHTSGSANLELFSSNSKPTPASPHAESTAISGHAERHQVILEKVDGDQKIEKSDPFSQRANYVKVTEFTRRLAGSAHVSKQHSALNGTPSKSHVQVIESGSSDCLSGERVHVAPISKQPRAPKKAFSTRMSNEVEVTVARLVKRRSSQVPELWTTGQTQSDTDLDDSVRNPEQQVMEETQLQKARPPVQDMDMEGNTLIGLEDEELPKEKASYVHFKSSPPPLDGSPSSHSSTSAEQEPRTDSQVCTSEAEEMEWEASLQPHQRVMQEQLLRVSRRVMRHVVDNESAATDIAENYTMDGRHMVQQLVNRHNGELAKMLDEREKQKEKMSKASRHLLRKISKGRQAVSDGLFTV